MKQTPHDLAGAYALDAVDGQERGRFEDHLTGCLACQDAVAGFRDTAGRLASLTETAPPAWIGMAVLAELTTGRPGASVPADPSGTGPRQYFPRPRSRRWLVAAAAGTLLAVGLVGDPGGSPPSPPTVAARILQAPDAQQVAQHLHGGTVTLVRSLQRHRMLVEARDLPVAPPGRDYQLWLRAPDGAMVSAGLIPAGSSNRTTDLRAAHRATSPEAAITIEPAGGSPRPTTTVVAIFTFS